MIYSAQINVNNYINLIKLTIRLTLILNQLQKILKNKYKFSMIKILNPN